MENPEIYSFPRHFAFKIVGSIVQPRGRQEIAQRFIAGLGSSIASPVRDGREWRSYHGFLSPLRGSGAFWEIGYPPLKRWAISCRPAGTLWQGSREDGGQTVDFTLQ